MAKNRLKYIGKEYPEKITRQFMIHSTHHDSMEAKERDIMFKAYRYDSKEKLYIIYRPELLIDSIIEKIIR